MRSSFGGLSHPLLGGDCGQTGVRRERHRGSLCVVASPPPCGPRHVGRRCAAVRRALPPGILRAATPWRQEVVHVLRSEWAALPPVPGSTVVRTNLSSGFVEPNTNFQVDYASTASCAEVQAHYATVAPAAGWTVQHPLQSFHHNTPPLDELETTYRKYVRTFTVSLSVNCFVEESGYSVFVDSPPID